VGVRSLGLRKWDILEASDDPGCKLLQAVAWRIAKSRAGVGVDSERVEEIKYIGISSRNGLDLFRSRKAVGRR